jgi:hypothetical protein
MYRTGDRAILLPDGDFDYLGRLDGQVKVRGHRVEIGEVEAAIEASGLCRACAVVPEASGDGVRLAAFVVWRDGADEDQLRAALSERLPACMVPSRTVGLGEMPLNANGKVDKGRLPKGAPLPGAAGVAEAGAPDGMEQALAAMVGALSPDPAPAPIPLDRSLLDFGLDSLQMMLLFSRAAKQFLPPSSRDALFSQAQAFLREPTVRQLASQVRGLAPAPGQTA